jgi:hypothetical protein
MGVAATFKHRLGVIDDSQLDLSQLVGRLSDLAVPHVCYQRVTNVWSF